MDDLLKTIRDLKVLNKNLLRLNDILQQELFEMVKQNEDLELKILLERATEGK